MMRKTQKATFAKPSSLPTKLAIALSSVMAAQAFAADYPNHEFGLYYRADLLINDSDNKNNKQADENDEFRSRHFAGNTIRVNFAGDLTDQTSYRVRWRPNRAPDDSDKDGFNRNFDYAYMTHNFNDNFAVRAGKFFWAARCGREGDYNGQDVYVYSATCNNGGSDYATGIGFMPMFAGQTLVLSVANGDESEANHSNFSYGISWYGNIADGMLLPIAYYKTESETKQKTYNAGPPVTVTTDEKAVTDTEWGIGTRLAMDNFFFELDYMTAKKEDDDPTNPMDEEYKSWVFAARAMLMNGSFQPHIKYVMDEYDDDDKNKQTTNSGDATRMAVALEYYPEMYKKKGVDWRVHLAWVQEDYDFENTNIKDWKDTQWILGFSFNFTNAGPK